MSELLEEAVVALRRMPRERRDGMARAILALADAAPGAIDPVDLPFVLEGLAQIERGEFASDDEVEAAFLTFER